MAMPMEVKTAEQAAMQEINQRLGSLHEHFSMAVDRMQRVLDRAFGSDPKAQSANAAPRPVPTGEIGAIRDRLNDLGALASEQAALLNRIDSIV